MIWKDGQTYMGSIYAYRCIRHNDDEAVLMSLDTGRFFVVPKSEWKLYQQIS